MSQRVLEILNPPHNALVIPKRGMVDRLCLSWLGWLGVDQAIFFNLLTRFWQAGAGFITLLFVARYLSPQEQGVYYTFNSVLALQVFFELGLTFVVMQFASHEMAHLEWTINGTLAGNSHAKARVASLLRLAANWYAVAAGSLILVVVPAGLLLFQRQASALDGVVYRLPWTTLVVFAAGSLLISPIFATLEGLGKVAEVARFRALQEIVSTVLLWLALCSRWGLIAACVFQASRLLSGGLWLFARQRPFLLDLLRLRSRHCGIHWGREIWPLQWKIAISWISGYLITQLFNPILFVFQGPVLAGRMGMSLTLASGLSGAAMAWINTKAPLFGILVARKDYRQLDRIFFTALWRCLLLGCVGAAALWLGVLYLGHVGHPLSQRLLTPSQLALLLVISVMGLIVSAQATYLRAHKQEPFMVLSVVNGVLTGLSALWMGWRFGVTAMLAGYFFTMLLAGLGWGSLIFCRCRRLWHVPQQS
ncbi:MAG: hypothetical protein HZA90_22465 [Verrucomicrobia bacterium]|nr:hypothetical protein [Verrucomicrobiota bacterium]